MNPMPHNPKPLLGLAIGDALSKPFIGTAAGSVPMNAWSGYYMPNDALEDDLGLGEYSCLSESAILTSTSLIECETYSPTGALSTYFRSYRKTPSKLPLTMQRACKRVAEGSHWDTSGITDAEDGEFLVRAVPIGFFYLGAPLTADFMSRVDAELTNDFESAARCSAVIGLGISLLSSGTILAKKDLLEAVIELSPESRIRSLLEELRAVLYLGQDKVSLGSDVKTPYLYDTFTAFRVFLQNESFRSCLVNSIKLGGNGGVRTALVGALAGSFFWTDDEEIQNYQKGLKNAKLFEDLENLILTRGQDSKNFQG